jgi:hypothetical protein
MESSNIDNSNRLVLLFVLGVVLYLLYRYQHYVINTTNPIVTTNVSNVVQSVPTMPIQSIIPAKIDPETSSSTKDNEISYQQDSMVNSMDSIYQDTISFNSIIDGDKKKEIFNNQELD